MFPLEHHTLSSCNLSILAKIVLVTRPKPKPAHCTKHIWFNVHLAANTHLCHRGTYWPQEMSFHILHWIHMLQVALNVSSSDYTICISSQVWRHIHRNTQKVTLPQSCHTAQHGPRWVQNGSLTQTSMWWKTKKVAVTCQLVLSQMFSMKGYQRSLCFDSWWICSEKHTKQLLQTSSQTTVW